MNSPWRTARSVLAALVLVMSMLAGVTTASATPRRSVEYDALGDSYASGYGVPPYQACGRSPAAYPVQLDGRRKIDLDDFVACAGDTTATLVAGGQLNSLDYGTDLVTITIGGNDIGWSETARACLGGTDAQCAGQLAVTSGKITAVLPGRLDSVYAEVKARAPDAHVVVTGYPRLFSPKDGPVLAASVSEQKALNHRADLLNTVIAKAAARRGFEFVDVAQRFRGHGMNAPDAWILGPSDPGFLHPNTDGYQAYTAAVTAAIKPSRGTGLARSGTRGRHYTPRRADVLLPAFGHVVGS